ncbi:antitoxin of toxin-antitoxin stability system [Sphingomonas sp. Leaf412]|uniref:hypothetical protein n=1 Tax=Sphingomonas sp. Leaf412 TaxID=1736370 RepID=UPI0006FB3FBD|nr:hypothetical protein [Sphingomonas sp. Leaf412]KQT31247.1 antitoxin of toxin-antitoxin stability system [Sphingomonas sp. Leaf412]
MSKEAVFTMKLEPDLRDAFMAAAQESHRPASQVLRELMREFIQRRHDHAAFVERKVEVARRSVATGRGRSDDAVERDFAARRSRTTGKQ